MLTSVVECDPGRGASQAANCLGYQRLARFGRRANPRGDVDGAARDDFTGADHVAGVHSDPQRELESGGATVGAAGEIEGAARRAEERDKAVAKRDAGDGRSAAGVDDVAQL